MTPSMNKWILFDDFCTVQLTLGTIHIIFSYLCTEVIMIQGSPVLCAEELVGL
jgi:hypothetical protein